MQRLSGNLALVIDMQLEEVAPGMRHAARFLDALSKQLLVGYVIVAHQRALPSTQKASSMRARAALAKVIDHGLQVFKGARRVSPQVRWLSRMLSPKVK